MNYLPIFEIQIFKNNWCYEKYLALDFENIEEIVDFWYSNFEILNGGFGAGIYKFEGNSFF